MRRQFSKRNIVLLLLSCSFLLMNGCTSPQGNRERIISAYQKNEDVFIDAVQSGDYSTVELLSIVKTVYVAKDYVDFQGKGYGLGPSTHYYGIFYSHDGDLCAVDVAGPREELTKSGAGYQYQENNGDNRYYVEPLGNNFFYYEAHF